MRNVATNVREAVVPGAGHWLMEESPTLTVALIRDFLKDWPPCPIETCPANYNSLPGMRAAALRGAAAGARAKMPNYSCANP